MKVAIDFKSLIVGILLGALTILSLAASGEAPPNERGRYQAVVAEGHVTIVDTQTGDFVYHALNRYAMHFDGRTGKKTADYRGAIKLEEEE